MRSARPAALARFMVTLFALSALTLPAARPLNAESTGAPRVTSPTDLCQMITRCTARCGGMTIDFCSP